MTTTPVGVPNIEGYVMAVQRVEALLRRVTGALDAAGIPYAVVGDNAVAAWVASVNASAGRIHHGLTGCNEAVTGARA